MWRFPDAQYAQKIRQPSKGTSLVRDEIERECSAHPVADGRRLTTSYRGPCDKGADQVYIYGLADPLDHVIRYVGKTSGGLGYRLDWHIKRPTNRGMADWLAGFRMRGIRPEIAVLGICHASKWESAEREWIARLRKVAPLLNVEDGGESRR